MLLRTLELEGSVPEPGEPSVQRDRKVGCSLSQIGLDAAWLDPHVVSLAQDFAPSQGSLLSRRLSFHVWVFILPGAHLCAVSQKHDFIPLYKGPRVPTSTMELGALFWFLPVTPMRVHGWGFLPVRVVFSPTDHQLRDGDCFPLLTDGGKPTRQGSLLFI